MESTQVLVAGGGAAGMAAAIAAAENNTDVLVIEKMDRPGKKILATGNGKCNYTNYYQGKECYHGDNPSFAWEALKKYGHKETIKLFKSYGILPSDRNGYVYPLSGQASCVRDILEIQLVMSGARLNTNEGITSVKTAGKGGFIVTTSQDKYFAEKLIIATGGMASPVHGSDGSGYNIAKSLGHTIIKPLPALVPCLLNEKFTKDWAGARTQGNIKAYAKNGRFLSGDSGELQFVSQGISGIPVFQVSRYISKELSTGNTPYLIIDIMPGYNKEEIMQELLHRKKQYGDYSTGSIFKGLLNNRLAQALLKKCGIPIKRPAKELAENSIARIATVIKEWRLDIEATGGFDKAQVTCGGVKTSEIEPATMQSKLHNGLYFAGEIIDVDGMCGGYNLQWAWTSGYIAGKSAGAL